MNFPRSSSPRQSFKKIAQRLSPFVVNIIDYTFSEMTYVPQGWYDVQGWSDSSVVSAQEKHWPILFENLQGPGPLGVSHLPWHTTREDLLDHNIIMSYGYVLARASRTRDSLSMLDWGGGVGHYCLYNKALLPEVAIDYHCYDIPNLCRLGRKLLPEAQLHDEESEVLGREYDLVVTSSSLHYFEHWREVFRKLARVTREYLYVSRLQTVSAAPSFVVLHRPARDGYAQFLSWCINSHELLNCAQECGLELVREFVFTEQWTIRGAPEKGDCRGFLFRR